MAWIAWWSNCTTTTTTQQQQQQPTEKQQNRASLSYQIFILEFQLPQLRVRAFYCDFLAAPHAHAHEQ